MGYLTMEASFHHSKLLLWSACLTKLPSPLGQGCTSRSVCISPSEPSSLVDPSAERGWVGREEEEADI